VVEVESELKELLRDRADEAGTDPTIAPALLRRARSRRRRTVALGGLLTVAVAAGSIVGVRTILDFEPPREVAAGPEWLGLWPQATREKAEDAQDEVDRLLENGACVSTEIESCNHALAWQLDGVEVVTRYTLDVLNWDQLFIEEGFEVSGADDPGPVLLHTGTCKTFATDACGYEARITVERLIRPGRGGLWFVTGVALSASEERAEALVRDFLQARVNGSGADAFLSPVAKGIYEDHLEGLSLYGDFTGFRILNAIVVREGVYRFEVLLEVSNAGADTQYRFENLSVGAGESLDGTQRAALILSTTVPSSAKDAETTTTPPTSLSDDEVMDFVAAFMEARLEGQGAENYLATQTSIAYEEHEQLWSDEEPGLYLYGSPHPEGDPSATYAGFRIEEVRPADASTCGWFSEAACQGAWEVVVVTDLEPVDGGQPEMQELLLVAPADGVAAEFADWMISGAARGGEPPSG
jgi:hypothetical protein